MTRKSQVPAVEGWFSADSDQPTLLGTQCAACGSRFFPRETFACKNPGCRSRDLEEVELGRRGTVWSFTDTHYQPPPPYVPTADPFEPFTLAAVELADDKMVVLGQMVPGVSVDDLSVGMEVELVLGTLYTDDDNEYVMWQWKPSRPSGGERETQPNGEVA